MPAQKLIQSQKQNLKITPRQIQFLNFLQLNEIELEELINQELEGNPMLEEETSGENWNLEYSTFGNTEKSFSLVEVQEDQSKDLRTELKEQLIYLSISSSQKRLAELLIDSVDERGFLPQTDEELEDVFSFMEGKFYNLQEIKTARKSIHLLEPTGIATENLQQFLLFQADEKKLPQSVIEIIDKHFHLLIEREFELLAVELGIELSELRELLNFISKLRPYPFYGQSQEAIEKEQIIPEFKVEIIQNEPVGGLLKGRKRKLQFVPVLESSLSKPQDKKTVSFLKKKTDDAQWFLEALKERESTMSACIATVVKLQKNYFRTGEIEDLRPMVLKDIADLTGRTLSTISRITSQKHVQTDFGIIPMRSLFSEAIQKANGEFISNRKVQDFVSQFVSEENKKEPLTDAEIQRKLSQQGVNVTRRTVTKYRDFLNIPSSKYRRAL
ncbi:RNA polymerase factor sigma-54 [Jiulongibacter sediminis]|uniref:RNA polymerase sigma54 factor n=1 Tax=Jiulongibacter sediminis TaxID=1605367 RepID=A0A0P7BBN8_9BACT|nr:RNA polymerase factor sigma-54 [Jiulongibacter sediminis]KPM47909.1 hypothetical protein AFM12_11820 [Jiulongibacter sediminis]TBX24092.1 hypothetical protein TK44_11830 [Jiulongibacter sediminis]